MRRLVAPWLPMDDPGSEARWLVRQGMVEILNALSDEIFDDFDNATVPYLRQVDVCVDEKRGITWVSAQVDRELMAMQTEINFLRYRLGLVVDDMYWRGQPITGLSPYGVA